MISWLFFKPGEAGIADMGKIIRVTNAPNTQTFQDTGQNLQLILAQTVTPHFAKSMMLERKPGWQLCGWSKETQRLRQIGDTQGVLRVNATSVALALACSQVEATSGA